MLSKKSLQGKEHKSIYAGLTRTRFGWCKVKLLLLTLGGNYRSP
jgi:hypothetical protein